MTPDEVLKLSMTKTPLEKKACKGCGRAIYFCKDGKGKVQCLDAIAPVFVQIRDSNEGQQEVMQVKGYVSHFATCPSANQFSKGGKNNE